ncbi:MAG: phosphotransferase [Longimicrobiales bacterium]|nr:phosphotransferase [Longimicrobiales bacterium]
MTVVDHAMLVGSMRDPAFYPHEVEAVGYIQTHISSVFLTGELVYKLKKPMNFGFLDFTTIELRRENCEKELRLNRRLAPSVYLRVEPITVDDGVPTLGGVGPVVDWVVVMRQVEQRLLGLRVMGRGDLTVEKIRSVVDTLVPFYQKARTGPGVDEFGSAGTVKFNTDENFEQTAGYVGIALTRERYDEIRSFTNDFLAGKEKLFQRRVAEGWVRECHGDLHLGNIFFEDSPVIFDCIEFNERFRCSDVAVDLAFLVMDLDFQGVPNLARAVVDRYVEQSGDSGFLEVVDFYCCYRAYVRGKIACFTSADPALDGAAKDRQLESAGRYFDLSHSYATQGGHGRDVQ